MTSSSIVFGIGLAMLLLAYVAVPFRRQGIRSPEGRHSGRLSSVEQKAAIYAAIREIDTDVQLGKLEAADHQYLRQRYLEEAAAVLRQLDSMSDDGVARSIEADVARIRQGEAIRERDGWSTCKTCGAAVDRADRFCASCGAGLGD